MPLFREIWPSSQPVPDNGAGSSLFLYAEGADRVLPWLLVASSVLMVAIQPFGELWLKAGVFSLGLCASVRGAFFIAPGSFLARLIAILAANAIAIWTFSVHPLLLPLFAALLLPALVLYLDPRMTILAGAIALAVKTALEVRTAYDWRLALVSSLALAGLTVLCSAAAVMLRRRTILLASQQQRIQALELDVETAQKNAGQALRIKHDLLANLSHEIRTPLNGVLGMTRLLLDTRLTGEQRELTQTLERSTTALLDIMNEVIDFSALESGNVHLDTHRFEFARPYEDVVELVGPLAQGKGIELLVEFDAAIPVQVVGDARRLRQVLLNLVGNALKFTETGHILIRTSVEEMRQDSVQVRTEVLDTGPGISQEDHGRIFQPFVQGKSEYAGQYGGAGLGLTISKRLVEMMKGEIGFKSHYGKGTRFWFTITCKRLENEPGMDTSALAGQRVLTLSRYAQAAGIAASQMRQWGIDAFAASQPDVAIGELVRARQSGKPYDIVVLDGEPSGPHSTTSLLERIRTLGRIPSVGVLPLGQWTANEHHGVFGFDAVVTKPLRPSQLWKALCVARFGPDSEEITEAIHGITDTGSGGVSTQCVLLVEDNPINQKVAKRMIEKLGYMVEIAPNGRHALEMMGRGTDYAAVLMDCMMPEMDGFEATREIRERESGVRRIPIIALTAHALHAERDRCLGAGMDDYITKPVHLEILRQTLERWIPQPPFARTHAGGHRG